MRKIFLACAGLSLLCGTAFAKSVDVNTAQTVGYNFLQNQGKQLKATDLSLVYQATSVVAGATITDFYIFNCAGGGFVMVSGDDRILPVLAFDPNSTFVVSPKFVNTNDVLNTYKKEINYVVGRNSAPVAKASSEWNTLQTDRAGSVSRTTATYVGPLVPVQWNQSPYVNQLCPVDPSSDSLSVTGCVATAMAQVMRYWKWPVSGTGANSYMDPFGVMLTANFSADVYKWDSMPEFIGDTNLYVAKLMYDVGVSVDMNYGVDGSSAQVNPYGSYPCAQTALTQNFGYNDTTIQSEYRQDYDDSDWVHLIDSEINAKRPVLYTGYGSEGGHCFIADGYVIDADNKLHFNWGWGGYCNGYYAVESLDPGGIDFDEDQSIVTGIMPDTMTIPAPTVDTTISTGVKQVAAKNGINIYPNPASDVLNVSFSGTTVSRISVADMTGNVLFTTNTTSGSSAAALSVSNYPDGIYLVELQTATGVLTRKVVIAR